MPTIRDLSQAERQELDEFAQQGLSVLPQDLGEGAKLIVRLEALRDLVDRVREGESPAPPYDESDELAYVLGSLWGSWVAERSGWAWKHLTLDDGMEGLALVPEDEAYAVWPHHFLYGLLELAEAENTALVLAECIWGRELPPAQPGELVLLS